MVNSGWQIDSPAWILKYSVSIWFSGAGVLLSRYSSVAISPHTIVAACVLLSLSCMPASANGAFAAARHGKGIIIQNDSVTVRVNPQSGSLDVFWRDGNKLLGVASAAQLEDGRTLSTTDYATHAMEPDGGSGASVPGSHAYTIRSVKSGMPDIVRHIWLYDGKPWIAIEAELTGDTAKAGTRHFDAALLQGLQAVQVGSGAALRVLHVPFDNDMWFRYDAMAVAGMKDGTRYSSAEVTAIYDNASRHGLVLGSITHDTWKTAIDVQAAAGHLTRVDVYGGITSPTGVRTETHDVVPHGLVHGERVVSPRIFIGSFGDWRDGLEAYGKANAEVHPALDWPEGAPMGWNSWAAYADKIDDHRYLGSAEYVRDTLVPQGFGRKGVVYVNLDAF